jgi:hypothetical protein
MEPEPTEWARLAREDPAQFERRRTAALEALIARSPEPLQSRLRALQLRIDLEREQACTPLDATVRLNAMMWEQLQALRAALNRLAMARLRAEPASSQLPQKVLPFLRPD